MFFSKLKALAQGIGFATMVVLMAYGAIGIFRYADQALAAPANSPVQQDTAAPKDVVATATDATTATTPGYFDYQGTLRDPEGKLLSGYYTMTFRIYDRVSAPLNAAIWSEQHRHVPVRGGQFSVLLGNNAPLPSNLFYTPDRFIGVTVAPYDEMLPRQRFASVPYAVYADHASSLTRPDGMTNQEVYVTPGGKVGVGTTKPALKLDIQGDFGRNNGATTLSLWGSRVGDDGAHGGLFLRSGSDIVTFDGNDRVGIGTESPQAALEVVGPVQADSLSTDPGIYNEVLAGLWPGVNLDDYSNRELRVESANNGGVYNQYILYNAHITTFDGNDNVKVTQGSYGQYSGLEFDNYGNVSVLVGDGTTYTGQDNLPDRTPKRALTVFASGDVNVNGNLTVKEDGPPVLIRRMTSLGDNADIPTDLSVATYNCVAAGWATGVYDIDEHAPSPNDNNLIWTYQKDGFWHVRASFNSDGPHENPSVDILCFRKEISTFEDPTHSLTNPSPK